MIFKYITIAKEIGINSQTDDDNKHPSITALMVNNPERVIFSFSFEHVDQKRVAKTINKLNPQKATRVDNLALKILKVTAEAISTHFSNIFNKSIKNWQFPDDLKEAQVTPFI